MGDALLDAARLLVGRPPCVELTWSVLRRAYRLEARTGGRLYRDLYVYDPERPWSPMDAAVRDLGGELVDAPVPGRWHLCQGWQLLTPDGRVPPPGPDVPDELGHSWLWWALTPTRGLALESGALRGVRWDRAPLLDDDPQVCGPGESWASRVDSYPAGVRLVVLPAPPERARR